MQITLVPDTNIFIEYQDLLSKFLNDVHPFNLEILILKIVLDELDKIKLKNHKAQIGNIFIQKNLSNKMVLIEGHVKKNGMEVIIDYWNIDKLKSNDDKIIQITSCVNHSVLITADRNMALKAKSKNVKCVFVKDKEYTDLKLEVYMSQTEAEPMELILDDPVPNIQKTVLDILKPLIEQILIANLGPGYKLRFEKDVQNSDLINLLKICVDNFVLFDGYLHKSSRAIIIEILKILKKEPCEEKKKISLQKILILFRINKEL
ncbi:KH domain-containing protein [Vairimorpha necatrix]|uniref:KH domain-containing protein n=1 Tax=Vairimorpha necatrix TaxID=6039 RepID=A0AAX4J8W1_9MICR